MANIALLPQTQAAIDTEESKPILEKRLEAIKKLPRYRGEVTSKNQIRQLPDVKPGEIFWVEQDNKAYLVAERDKQKITIKALDETATLSTGITIYDLNKQLVSKEPLFDWDDEEAKEKLTKRFEQFFYEDTDDEYYLLYGRDIHYVSLILQTRETTNWETMFDTLAAVGELISIDFNTSDDEVSAEIWIRTPDSKAELLYLMPFDRGLVIV